MWGIGQVGFCPQLFARQNLVTQLFLHAAIIDKFQFQSPK